MESGQQSRTQKGRFARTRGAYYRNKRPLFQGGFQPLDQSIATVEIGCMLLIEGEKAAIRIAGLYPLACQAAGFDLVAQGHRLDRGGNVHVFGQQTTACLELVEGRAALAIQGQHAHQLAMDLFLFGQDCQGASQVADGLIEFLTPFPKGGHMGQYCQHLSGQYLPLRHLPGGKAIAIRQGETGQEVIPIERYGLLKTRNARRACVQATMSVYPARVKQRCESAHVQPEVSRWIDGYGLSTNLQ